MMTKKDFIFIADVLRHYGIRSNDPAVHALIDAFRDINTKFDEERWINYLDKPKPTGRILA